LEPPSTEITLIGHDPSLAYLISRFAEQSGCRVTVLKCIPPVGENKARKPWIVLFSSMDNLKSAQVLVGQLTTSEIPVGVCASVGDEARARELGDDHYLLHPLTEVFMAALTGNGLVGLSGIGQDET
jgi:CheY-like chemotaxis protein